MAREAQEVYTIQSCIYLQLGEVEVRRAQQDNEQQASKRDPLEQSFLVPGH